MKYVCINTLTSTTLANTDIPVFAVFIEGKVYEDCDVFSTGNSVNEIYICMLDEHMMYFMFCESLDDNFPFDKYFITLEEARKRKIINICNDLI